MYGKALYLKKKMTMKSGFYRHIEGLGRKCG